MHYRKEIDGLRALAVVPVILFHAGFEAFGGGFVGVDIFFVISGYLITTIIVTELEQGRFSIADFYERRARRILPALFTVMLLVIPFAWFWLLPGDLVQFSRSLASVSVFASNFLFWSESGYFDTAAESKPLLHTWSLAVEEQYYVLFPLFLLAFWNLGQRIILISLGTVFLASLAFAQWAAHQYPSAAFYLLPARGWELLIGAFSAFFLIKRNNCFSKFVSEIGGWLGLALIAFSIFTYSKATTFPGFTALTPTIGTALIILFANEKTSVGRFVGNRVFVNIGLISYSAYLWHQPLFAFARHRSQGEPSQLLFFGLSALTLALAFISWRYVEAPFRSRTTTSRKKVVIFATSLTAAFLIAGLAGSYKTSPIYEMRFSKKELDILNSRYNISDRFDFLGHRSAEPDWMLIGDSHANSLQESFHAALLDSKQSSLVKTIDGCPPAQNLVRYDLQYGNRCHEHYSEVIRAIKEKGIKNVLIAARLPLYINATRFNNEEGGIEQGQTKEVIYDHQNLVGGIRENSLRAKLIADEIYKLTEQITLAGAKVFIIHSIPEVGWDVPKAAFFLGDTRGEIKFKRSVYEKRVQPLQYLKGRLESLENVYLLEASEAFCDHDFCYATQNRIPLYTDSNHLSRDGAHRLFKHLSSQLNRRENRSD